MNLFDSIQRHTFDVCTNTFGDVAVWLPSDGSAEQRGKVLFNDPAKADSLGRMQGAYGEIEYNPPAPYMEFREGIFEGLRASVKSGRYEEVSINGVLYEVQTVAPTRDGKTYKAELKEQ